MGSKVRFNWGERETLSLICGYEEMSHLENHPTKMKTFWKTVVEFMLNNAGIQVTEEKAKEKWKRLKEAYGNARLKMNTSGETVSSFKYFDRMDQIFGTRPMVAGGQSMALGATRSIPQNDLRNYEDFEEIDDYDTFTLNHSNADMYPTSENSQREISEVQNISTPSTSTGITGSNFETHTSHTIEILQRNDSNSSILNNSNRIDNSQTGIISRRNVTISVNQSTFNERNMSQSADFSQRRNPVPSISRETDHTSLPTASTGFERRRRRRENNFEKFLNLKERELKLQEDKLSYLKERDATLEKNKFERHQQRRKDLFRLMGISERESDEE